MCSSESARRLRAACVISPEKCLFHVGRGTQAEKRFPKALFCCREMFRLWWVSTELFSPFPFSPPVGWSWGFWQGKHTWQAAAPWETGPSVLDCTLGTCRSKGSARALLQLAQGRRKNNPDIAGLLPTASVFFLICLRSTQGRLCSPQPCWSLPAGVAAAPVQGCKCLGCESEQGDPSLAGVRAPDQLSSWFLPGVGSGEGWQLHVCCPAGLCCDSRHPFSHQEFAKTRVALAQQVAVFSLIFYFPFPLPLNQHQQIRGKQATGFPLAFCAGRAPHCLHQTLYAALDVPLSLSCLFLYIAFHIIYGTHPGCNRSSKRCSGSKGDALLPQEEDSLAKWFSGS